MFMSQLWDIWEVLHPIGSTTDTYLNIVNYNINIFHLYHNSVSPSYSVSRTSQTRWYKMLEHMIIVVIAILEL